MLVSPGWCACSLVLSVSLSLLGPVCNGHVYVRPQWVRVFMGTHTHTQTRGPHRFAISRSRALSLSFALRHSETASMSSTSPAAAAAPQKGPPRANMLLLRAGFCTFYCRAVHARAHEVSAHAQVYRNRAARSARKHGKDGRKLAKRRLARACLWTFNLGPEIINDTSLDEA